MDDALRLRPPFGAEELRQMVHGALAGLDAEGVAVQDVLDVERAGDGGSAGRTAFCHAGGFCLCHGRRRSHDQNSAASPRQSQ